MTSAVIVSTARTPLAKSWKGSFNMTHGATLGGHAVQHAVLRAGIDGADVDDVIMGCATPEGATGSNIARQIALKAGLPAQDLADLIRQLSEQMHTAAEQLQFELAARLRDEIRDLKKELRQMTEANK